jgi:hypothetical protein
VRKKNVSLLLLALGLLLFRCNLPVRTVTPTNAVRSEVTNRSQEVVKFKFLGTYPTLKDRMIVLYRYKRILAKDTYPEKILGYAAVDRHFWTGWQIGETSEGPSLSQDNPDRLVDFNLAYSLNRFTILYGEIITRKIVDIVAILDNGERLLAETDQEGFAFFAPRPVAPCELQVLEANGDILEKYEVYRYLEVPHHCQGK